jgi:hypothetical protein
VNSGAPGAGGIFLGSVVVHRKACTEHRDAVHIQFAFEERGMEGEKLEKYIVDETDEAYHRMEDASADLVNTKPTAKLAGILALCRYIGPLFEGDDSPDLPEYISYDDDTQATPTEALCHVHFTSGNWSSREGGACWPGLLGQLRGFIFRDGSDHPTSFLTAAAVRHFAHVDGGLSREEIRTWALMGAGAFIGVLLATLFFQRQR